MSLVIQGESKYTWDQILKNFENFDLEVELRKELGNFKSGKYNTDMARKKTWKELYYKYAPKYLKDQPITRENLDENTLNRTSCYEGIDVHRLKERLLEECENED